VSSIRPTGVCPCCRQTYRLTRAGRIWTHTKYGAASAGVRTPRCPGTGQAPGVGTLTPEREQEIDQLLADTDKLLATLAPTSTTGDRR
jgi:hypothetical protein